MTVTVAIVVPLAAVTAYAAFGWRAVTAWLGALAGLAVLAAGVVGAIDGTAARAWGGLLYRDALSSYLLIVIGAVAVIAMAAMPAYLAAHLADQRIGVLTARWYAALSCAFLAALAAAVLSAGVAALWFSLGAAAAVTTVLLGYRRDRAGMAAAGRYLLVCGIGLAAALAGAAGLGLLTPIDSLHLTATPTPETSTVAQIAAVALILGLAAGAGLVPLHGWSPGSQSRLPAPLAAMLPGAGAGVALYAILRLGPIVDAITLTDLARRLLLISGLASILLAAIYLAATRDHRHLLGHVSLANLGLMAAGIAIGGEAALSAVGFLLLSHGLVMAVLWLMAGRIADMIGSGRIDLVRGLIRRVPLLGIGFAAALVTMLVIPGIGLGVLGLAAAGIQAGLGWAVAVVIAGMTLVTIAAAAHCLPMLLGRPDSHRDLTTGPVRPLGSLAPVLVGGLAVAVGVVAAAVPLEPLWRQAAGVVAGIW